jgi:hypothetical protein
MRTPVEIAVTKLVPVKEKHRATAEDAASVSRPFSLILAEAEAVHDVVRVSWEAPQYASAVGTWRDAWTGLCRGANLLMTGQARLEAPGRQRRKGN